MKTINNELIRLFNPCYDPSAVGIDNEESLPVIDWVVKYRNTVKEKQDVIWLLCRKEFMSDRDVRLFAVWCAREGLKLIESPDPRSINACDVAEKYANGQATGEELDAARADAWAAATDTAWAAAAAATAAAAAAWAAERAAWAAAWAAERAAWAAAGDAEMDAEMDAQIDQLLTYFK